jgi:hypothetical protein
VSEITKYLSSCDWITSVKYKVFKVILVAVSVRTPTILGLINSPFRG